MLLRRAIPKGWPSQPMTDTNGAGPHKAPPSDSCKPLHPLHAAEAGEKTPPAHLGAFEFNDLEEIKGALAISMEDRRRATWDIADTCAVARCMFPNDQQLVNELAAFLGVSGMSVRRWIAIGMVYPPHVKVNGEMEVLRAPDHPLNLYYFGLEAVRYGQDPVEAVLKALGEGWKPQQLLNHLRTGSDNPPSRVEVYSTMWADEHLGNIQDIGFMRNQVADAIVAAFKAIDARQNHVLHVRFRVEAMYERKHNVSDTQEGETT